MSEARERYVANLRAILRALREANPDGAHPGLGLYDPFSGEAGPGASAPRSSSNGTRSRPRRPWLSGVPVVPTFDLFQGRPDRLAADRYHPNRAGYRLIAERMLQVGG